MRYRRLAASIVVVLLFGLIGSVAGPGWNPQPLEHALVPQSADTTIAPELDDVITESVGTYNVDRDVVDVELPDGVTIQATIATPAGASGQRPGVLFMHGAGTSTHRNFHDITGALASAGVVTMVPDKRQDTYTTRARNYLDMAEDYLHSHAVLRSWPGVDPGRVGVYGESEGAMPAPVTAVIDEDVAFVALASAPVFPIREQGAYAADNYLRDVGVPHRILRAIPRLVGGAFPGGGFDYFDFDVRPYQQRLDVPVFMTYGTADPSMPIVQGAQALIDDLRQAGNDGYTIRYYEGANHGLRIGGEIVPEFPGDLARWILGLPQTAGAPPVIAGGEPVQSFRVDPVDRPRWFATGDMIVYTFIAGAGLIGLGALGGAGVLGVRAVRRRQLARRRPGIVHMASGLAMASLATWVMFLSYLAGVANLALNYENDAFRVQGGWLLVQGTGGLASVMLVLTVANTRQAWREHRALAGPVMSRATLLAAVCLVGGSLVLLLSAAYWGVFPTVL